MSIVGRASSLLANLLSCGLFSSTILSSNLHHAEKYLRDQLNWPKSLTSKRKYESRTKTIPSADRSTYDLIDILHGLLKYDFANRLKAHEALRHLFFTRIHRR